MVRFGLIINPYSRRMRRKQGLSNMLGIATHYGIPTVLPEESSGPTPEAYRNPLEGLLDRGIDVLLVCSGDGGHHLVDTALFSLVNEEYMPMQANLRGGTMNIRSDSAGLSRRSVFEMLPYGPSSSQHLLQKFAEEYIDTPPGDVAFVERRLLRVRADGKDLLGFVYSSGLVVPFFDRYYQYGGYHLDVFKVIGEALLSLPFPNGIIHRMFDPVALDISLDNQRLDSSHYRATLLLGQDVRMDFGPLELHASQLEGVNDTGKVRFLATPNCGPLQMAGCIPSVFTLKGAKPGSFSLPDLIKSDVGSVHIHGPHRFLVDGDLYAAQDSVAVTMTKALRYAVV